jgi:hypothetical protein
VSRRHSLTGSIGPVGSRQRTQAIPPALLPEFRAIRTRVSRRYSEDTTGLRDQRTNTGAASTYRASGVSPCHSPSTRSPVAHTDRPLDRHCCHGVALPLSNRDHRGADVHQLPGSQVADQPLQPAFCRSGVVPLSTATATSRHGAGGKIHRARLETGAQNGPTPAASRPCR